MIKNLNIPALIVVFLVIVLFLPIYAPLYIRFMARDSYYSHGFLIPFVSLYLAFRKRKILQAIKPESDIKGLFIFSTGIIIHLVSAALRVNFISYFTLPVVIFGLFLYLGGKKLARELLFPLIFLIFMLPLPKIVIIGIAFKLKMIAAEAATFLAAKMGLDVNRAGSTIYYPGGQLLVGDPCSGLRSLITFLALGALFTQFAAASFWKRQLLFMFSLPVAVVTNLLRLTFLVLIGYVYGEKVATGFLHDLSGFMVFVLGFFGLIFISKVLRCPLTAGNIQ